MGEDAAASKPAIEVIVGEDAAASKPAIEVINRSPASVSSCDAYREMIEVNLELGRNAMAIYQDLVTEHKYEHGYASVMRFVRKFRGGQTPEARVPIQTQAGQESQVDYGEGPDGPLPDDRKVSSHPTLHLNVGAQPKVGAAAGVEIELTCLGRIARASIPSPWRRNTCGGFG